MDSLSPCDLDRWEWGEIRLVVETYAGRPCVRIDGLGTYAQARGVELVEGVIEADVAIPRGRSFHGLAWRLTDGPHHESFFVRTHQVGNDDAIQYTPAFHGVSSWQLYHGDGFWRALEFPLGDWFTIRLALAGDRLQVQVDGREAIAVTRQRVPVEPGGVGLLAGGDDYRVADLRWSPAAPDLRPLPPERRTPGAIERWQASEPFAEVEIEARLRPRRDWTTVDAEPSGLLDISRVAALWDESNTGLARTTLRSEEARVAPLEFGFSDRVTLFLNGRPLFGGRDGYRSRDYRFLGSIGWFDTVHLPLVPGDNELVAAVSEDFGGWGIQARLL
ncbi:MAG: hypothetical protein ACXVRJ_04745 [Gaiellaceae bacterium]